MEEHLICEHCTRPVRYSSPGVSAQRIGFEPVLVHVDTGKRSCYKGSPWTPLATYDSDAALDDLSDMERTLEAL